MLEINIAFTIFFIYATF